MITWVIGGILIVWILIRRFSEGGKVEGEPLGMPRGTVRAVIAIMIVSFPLGYLIFDQIIPGLIVSAVFIVVAFYFQSRKSATEKLKSIVNELKNPETEEELIREKKYQPLYLPKYSVRVSLLVILIVTQILIFSKTDASDSFAVTNTLADILLMIILFLIGVSIRGILKHKEKKSISEQIKEMDSSLSDVEIIEQLMLKEKGWWKNKGKTIFSLIMLGVVVFSLLLYTFNLDYNIFEKSAYTLTLQGALLVLVNIYYGVRD